MKKFLQKRKRKGFTLVELLIVIIIIGILAGSMLLVMGAGKDKAEATKIVSDLRNLKAASLMFYADNDAWPTAIANLNSYMDSDTSDYTVAVSGTDSDDCWLGTTVVADSGIAEKLQAMEEQGIPLKKTKVASDDYVSSASSVFMEVN